MSCIFCPLALPVSSIFNSELFQQTLELPQLPQGSPAVLELPQLF
jgi:hypothetical protein